MNFFLNHSLISLNTAPTPQMIFLMIIEKHILRIWNVSYKSSSYWPLSKYHISKLGGWLADVILKHSLIVIFHYRSYSLSGYLLNVAAFHLIYFPIKVIFCWKSSSIEGGLSLNVVLLWILISMLERLLF